MMRILTRLASVWQTLFRKDRLDADLDAELAAAVDTLAARYRAEGMDAAAARREAVRALCGPCTLHQVRSEVRQARLGAGLDALLLDLRYGWRALVKARGLAAVVVITLALGIGANTAIFSIVHALLLEPLPYRDADRLTFVWLNRRVANDTSTGTAPGLGPMSGPDLRNLRAGTRTFEDFGAIWASGTIPLTEGLEPEQLRAALVTTNFFQVLGVNCALGRSFLPEDSAEGAGHRAIIGWGLFQRRFGGDRSVVGRRIKVNDDYATIVGVLPRDFRLLLPPDSATPDHLQIFTPFWPDVEGGPRRNLFLRVIGRMRPGVTITQARADVDEMARGLSRELGTPREFTTMLLHDEGVKEIRGPLVALFVGVGILLLIACVNVASLLIAHAASRSSETALRLALGASRGRLVRQSLVEGLVLTLLGAVAGIGVGYAALRLLLALAPESLNRLDASHIDRTVLAFTGGISVVWGVLLSLAPLVEMFKADASRTLQRQSRAIAGRIRYRTRASLVIGQVALSVVLLVCAVLLVRGFVALLRVDPGFQAERLLTFRTLIPRETFIRELQERLAALPGVKGSGAFSHLPYDDLPNWGLPYTLDAALPPDAPYVDARAISPGLLEVLGAQLLEGRFFTEHDRDAKNVVAVIDDKFARLLWPDRSAVGQRFRVRIGSEQATVVGVVRHLRLRSLLDDLRPQMFVPWYAAQRNPMAVVVRTTGDPVTLASAVRTTVLSLDRRLGIYDVRPMTDYMEAARAMRRFTMLLAAAFAATALVLTCVGVYGVLAYAVAYRRHEFGVRRALGASAGTVVREVLREGLGFAVMGVICGAAAAFVLARLQSQLYVVNSRDPLSFVAAIVLIFAGAVLACWVPAQRAMAVSPMDALRSE